MARRNQAEIVLTARDRTKTAFSAVNQRLGKFASVGLAGAVAGLALLTRASLKQIDILAKTSQKLGITTEALTGLRLAAEKTGLTTKNLDLGIQRMTRRIAEAAAGSGEAVKALDELGLSAVSLAQKSPDEQMLELADAFEKVTGQSDKVRLGFKLFDSEGVALINTLALGREGLLASAEATKRFGTAISAVDAKTVEDANDAFTDLREAVKGVGFDLARRFAPGMEAASTSTANFIVTIRRDFIPAMALLLEQIGLIENNVRGLSDIELAIRVEVQEDSIREVERRTAMFEATGRTKRLSALNELEASKTEIMQLRLQERQRMEFSAELAAEEERLAEVKNEQERRANIILEADRKLEDMRVAQTEDARQKALEVERDADQIIFEEKLALEEERNREFIKLALSRAREERRLRFQEARQAQRLITAQGIFEARAAQATIRLRQQTAATSVQILQTLFGKNKTIARALFLVEKGLAIARTIQNTAAASVKALAELGPIAGPPAAAAIQAFGAAQVGLIAATALTGVGSIGGGGGSLSGIGGLGGGGFAGGRDSGGDQFAGEQIGSSGGGPVQEQGVVQLIFPSLFGITPEAIDALADALRDASENRDIVVVSGTGRNADILAEGANT